MASESSRASTQCGSWDEISTTSSHLRRHVLVVEVEQELALQHMRHLFMLMAVASDDSALLEVNPGGSHAVAVDYASPRGLAELLKLDLIPGMQLHGGQSGGMTLPRNRCPYIIRLMTDSRYQHRPGTGSSGSLPTAEPETRGQGHNPLAWVPMDSLIALGALAEGCGEAGRGTSAGGRSMRLGRRRKTLGGRRMDRGPIGAQATHRRVSRACPSCRLAGAVKWRRGDGWSRRDASSPDCSDSATTSASRSWISFAPIGP